MENYKNKIIDFKNALELLEKNTENFLSFKKSKSSFNNQKIKLEVEKLKNKLTKIINNLDKS